MSETKHTPGPWHVLNHGPHYNNPRIDHLEIAWSKDGELVTELVYGKANADLIAAAPDLLAVARYAIDNPEFRSDEFDRLARAALAKAQGHAHG